MRRQISNYFFNSLLGDRLVDFLKVAETASEGNIIQCLRKLGQARLTTLVESTAVAEMET